MARNGAGWVERVFDAAKLPVFLQAEASECGLASIAMVARYHGSENDLSALRRRFMVSTRGATMSDIVRTAGKLELSARALRLEPAGLGRLQLPAILHWDMNHFVVLASVGRGHVVIHDPAVGRKKVSLADVSRHFTGIALELLPTLQFERRKPVGEFGLGSLFAGIRGLTSAILQIVALAAALEIAGLIVPFLTQWVIDGAIVSGDQSLLVTIGLAYGLLIVLQVALMAMRGWSLIYVGTQINVHWMVAVFSHLLRLPLSYFEKRHLGDIVSRFQAVATIQQSLSASFFTSALDGVMGLAAFCAMAFYSLPLTAVAALAVLLYVGLRWTLYDLMRGASAESATKWAFQYSHFLESMRNIQTLRLYAMEEQRKARWLSILVQAVNRDVLLARITNLYNAANFGIFGFERLFVLVIGASNVLAHHLSLGMLVALLAFNEMILQRMPSLIDNLYSLRMLQVPIDRVADIALSEPEPLQESSSIQISGPIRIEVRDVSYRYSSADPYVLRNISFEVEPGSFTAVSGPSGGGKTTLIKIVLGLLQPESGKVLVNGIDIHKQGLTAFRSALGTVMQEDKLFAGSIADNIACFEEPRDQKRIVAAAEAAAIHEDIAKMPMQYESLVGDMGSAFSGGQRQRILLARALYRDPKVLILDEATSALDKASETKVIDALEGLNVTRLVIAHRQETLDRAEYIVEVRDGAANSRRRDDQGVAK